MNEIKVYTLSEVAEILHLTRRTVYSYVKSKKIKAVKIGRQWRVSQEAMREFVDKGTE
ncbi:MAG: DNA-binding protein [Bacteroidia bacterium]|jgi:excisionase family DNA binding protein|nr:DNA-binding protein [Bacteroidia bacterium]